MRPAYDGRGLRIKESTTAPQSPPVLSLESAMRSDHLLSVLGLAFTVFAWLVPRDRAIAAVRDLKRRLWPPQASPAYLNLSPAVGVSSATLSLSVGDSSRVRDVPRVHIEPQSP